jgi:hypothetical protein
VGISCLLWVACDLPVPLTVGLLEPESPGLYEVLGAMQESHVTRGLTSITLPDGNQALSLAGTLARCSTVVYPGRGGYRIRTNGGLWNMRATPLAVTRIGEPQVPPTIETHFLLMSPKINACIVARGQGIFRTPC